MEALLDARLARSMVAKNCPMKGAWARHWHACPRDAIFAKPHKRVFALTG
jgi:hypothetical protein